jgi:hypothetical protein
MSFQTFKSIAPESNINGNFVNVDNSHNGGMFGSNQIPGLPGLAGAKNNVDAAKGYVPGICMNGGKKIKRKIKNITKMYKMRHSKKKIASMKKRILRNINTKTKTNKKSKSNKKRSTRRRRQRGGYAQYQNNLPLTPTYSIGGILNSHDLGLANPPPYKILPNSGQCTDNYNHYTGKGFPSRGH